MALENGSSLGGGLGAQGSQNIFETGDETPQVGVSETSPATPHCPTKKR